MTTKKRLAIFAAAGTLLTLTRGTVYAVVCCELGTVKKAGAVYYNPTTGLNVKTSHTATLLCDQDKLDTNSDWNGLTERAFELPGTGKDGMLAATLTALADDKKVTYCLENAKEPTLLPNNNSNKNGHVLAFEVTDTPL